MNAIEFLKSWCGEAGPFSVGAIDPNDETSKGHDWLTTSDVAEVERFVEANAGKRNLYLQINPIRRDLGTRRAHRGDVAVAVCVHAEIDPPKDIDSTERLEEWQLAKGEELISDDYWLGLGLPRPTSFVFSGTGYVVMWRLESPVVLWREGDNGLAQDPFLVDAVESRNRALVSKLDADPMSVDVSRLLRLPGTLNIPGESKKKKGRTENVLAEVIEYEPERVTSLAFLPAAAPQIARADIEIPEFDGAPPAESIEEAAHVLGEVWPTQGRHQAHLALSGSLARVGWPAELIASFAAKVAEVQEPGNAKYDKRLKAAETSVTKVRSGNIVTGWPSLIEHVGEDVVAHIRNILNLPAPVENDPEFTAALMQGDPDNDPSPNRDKVRSALETARDKLKRKTKEDSKYHGKLLGKVLAGEKLVREDENPIKALCEAALLVVRHVPKGTSDEQVAEILLGCASGMGLKSKLSDIVAGAKQHFDKLRTADAARREPDEFVLQDSGPNAGSPVAKSQHNIRVGLRRLGVTLRYNAFANQKLITRDDSEGVLQDEHVEDLLKEFEQNFNIIPEDGYFRRICNSISRENTFHPVRDYLDALPIDIPPEFLDLPQTWLIRFAGAEDTPYTRAVSQLMLVAAVRRIRQPGCLFQEMLILETPTQGKGKSEGLRALVPDPEWFSDDFALHTDDSKRMLEQTDGKWIIECAELKGFLRTSDDSVKQYLSRRSDQARMAYGHEPRFKLREFVLFGTINDLEYLKDLTGNRRYWPVRIQQFDIQGLIAVRDMLWAAASALEMEHPEGEYIRLDPSLYAAAAEEQEKRRMVSPVEDALRDLLEGVTGALQVSDVYKVLHEDKLPSKGQKQEITAVLQALGFIPERTSKVDGKQKKWYIRGDTDAERRVRITITGSTITGFEVKLSQTVPTPVAPAPHGPEAPAN